MMERRLGWRSKWFWRHLLSLFLLASLCQSLATGASFKNVSTTTVSNVSQEMNLEVWSKWYNSDNPGTGHGDLETPTLIRERTGLSVCPGGVATAAQCMVGTESFTGRSPYDELTTPCSRFGIECYNEAQVLGLCSDYRIRFLCQPVEGAPNDGHGNTDEPEFFDARVYILLALIPCSIFILRLLWTCCSQRRKRRMEERNESFISSTDDESFEITMPPPTYEELFDDSDSIFVICGPSNGPVYSCPSCERSGCSVFSACNRRLSGRNAAQRRDRGRMVCSSSSSSLAPQFRGRNEGSRGSRTIGRRASLIMRRILSSRSLRAGLPRPASCSQLDTTPAARGDAAAVDSVVVAIRDDDVFAASDSGLAFTCQGHCDGSGSRQSLTSELSAQDAGISGGNCPPPVVNGTGYSRPHTAQTVRASPCTCSCHRCQYSHVAVVQDEPPAYSNFRSEVHVPISIPRNISTSSLPSYEQALEILKHKKCCA